MVVVVVCDSTIVVLVVLCGGGMWYVHVLVVVYACLGVYKVSEPRAV